MSNANHTFTHCVHSAPGPRVELLESRQLLAAEFVIAISVDGLRPDAITQLGAAQLPHFYRLRTQGAFTDNARTDYDNTVTLPNHTSMVTGRPLVGGAGHNWTGDGDPLPGQTLHSNKRAYVASAWDVVHDRGRRTGVFATKAKFVLYDNTYDADTASLQGGALDVTGVDNGRDKIDVASFHSDEALMTGAFVSAMGANPLGFSMIHYAGPDQAGHAGGWMDTAYMAAVRKVDGELGRIFRLIDTTAALAGKTAVILTADHGGDNTAHHDPNNARDYTIPFYVWGPGVTAGNDLYAMNPTTRRDPGGGRPTHSASPQPIRTADVANLALDLLGYPAVPGSTFNASQELNVGGPPLSNRPAAPTNLRVTSVSASQIVLAWNDNANNESGYKVERSTDGVTFAPLTGTVANATTSTNSGLTSGRRYYYRVYAWNSSGNSAFSNVVSAVTGQTNPPPPPTAPAAPTALTASAVSSSQINLAWSDNAGNETGYRVERSTNGTPWTLLSNFGVNQRSASITGLAADTRYYFRVQALGSSGNSGWSNVADTTTFGANPTPGAPAAATLLSVVASTTVANAINVSWRDNAGNESGYKIERSTDGVNFSIVGGTGAGGTFHRNTNLTAGRRYWYRVYAWNAAGNSARSAVMSAVAQATTNPVPEPPLPPPPPPSPTLGTPTLVRVLPSTTVAHALNLTWSDNSGGESGFKIERSTDGRNFYVLTGTTANSTFSRDSNLTAGRRYWYRVYAWNDAGRSAYSNVISAVAT